MKRFGLVAAALVGLTWATSAAASDRTACAGGDAEACRRVEGLGEAIAACLGGDVDRCAALADEDLDGAPVREHTCDRSGPACESALAAAERAWRDAGDPLWFHLRQVACGRGDTTRCGVPADRLTAPRGLAPGRSVSFDAGGAVLISSGEDVGGYDPSTFAPLDWGTAGTGNLVVDLEPAPGGWVAAVVPRDTRRADAGDVGLVGPTGEVRWIGGPACSVRALRDGGAIVVLGRDPSCAEAVAVDRVDARGQRVGPRWVWSGAPPVGFDGGPSRMLVVDAAGRLHVRAGGGAPAIVPTPRPVVGARLVGDRVLALAEEGWWVLSPTPGGLRVSGEGPERVEAVGVSADGTAFAFTHRRDGVRHVRRVDPADVGGGVGLAIGPEGRSTTVDLALSPDGRTVAVAAGNEVSLLEHQPARPVDPWKAPPWTPLTDEGALGRVVVVDRERRPVAGATVVSASDGTEHVTGPDGSAVVPPGAVAVTTPDGRAGAGVSREREERVVVEVRHRIHFRVLDEGGAPVVGAQVTPFGGAGHTWTDDAGRGWFFAAAGPVREVRVGDVSVDPAGGDWVVPTGQVRLTGVPLGITLSSVRDAAGVTHRPIGPVSTQVAEGPAVARVYAHDGRVATEPVVVPRGGVVELSPRFSDPVTLEVRVLDPDGVPAPGLRVAPEPAERGARAPAPAWSDAEGRVRFTVSDGPWTIRGRDPVGRTGEVSVRVEPGRPASLDLRVDRPADLVWPGWSLDEEGTVTSLVDGSPLAALFDPGDRLSTDAGPVTGAELDHLVRRADGERVLRVRAPDGAERTAGLPAGPRCDRAGRCVVSAGGREVVVRAPTGDRSGADALAPPRWPPAIPVVPPSPDAVACASGDAAACDRANVYVPEPPPAPEWRDPGLRLRGPSALAFTTDGALVAVSEGTLRAIDPVTGRVLARSPLAEGGEEVLAVRRVVAAEDGGVRAVVDDRDWVPRAPGGWRQVPLRSDRGVVWLGGPDGVACAVTALADGAVGFWSPDAQCGVELELRRWDADGRLRSRTPAPPGGAAVDALGQQLFVAGSSGVFVGPAEGPLAQWSTVAATGVRAVAPDRALAWSGSRWWLLGPDGSLADGEVGNPRVAAANGVVVVGDSLGPLRLLDAGTGRGLREPIEVRVDAVALSADAATVAFLHDGELAFVDRAPPTAPRRIPGWRATPQLLARTPEETPATATLRGSGPPGARVTLEAGWEPGPGGAVPDLHAEVGPDGAWSLAVPPGSYRLRVGEVPAGRVRLAGPSLEAPDLALERLVVRDPGGDPLPGAVIHGRDGIRLGVTGPDGSAVVAGPVQDAVARARDRVGFFVDGVAVLDRTDLAPFRVVDERGRPLGGATLHLDDAGGQTVTSDDGAGWFVLRDPTVPPHRRPGFEPSVTFGDRAVAASFGEAPIVFPTGEVVARVPAEAREVLLRDARGQLWTREVDGADTVRFTGLWGGPAEVRWLAADGRSARSRVRVVPGRASAARWEPVEAPARLVVRPRGADGTPCTRSRVDLVLPPSQGLRPLGDTDVAGVLEVAVPAGPIVVSAGLCGGVALVARAGEVHTLQLSPAEATTALWPGVRLGTDGRVVEVAPDAPWAANLRVGDRLVATPAGPVRGRPIDEVWVELAMAEAPTPVTVEGADGARRTEPLAGRPRCTRSGCVVPTADGLRRQRWGW